VVGFVGVTAVVVGWAVVVVGAAVVVVGAAVVVVGAAVVVGAVVVTHTGQHAPPWFSGRNPSGHVGQVGRMHTISPTFLPWFNRHTHSSQLSVHLSPITYVLLLYTQTGARVVVGAAVVVDGPVVLGSVVETGTQTSQQALATLLGRNPSGHVGQVGLMHTISPTFLPALNRHTHCSQLSVHLSPITYVLLLYTQTGACVVVGAAVVVGADVVVGAAVVVVGAAVVVFGTHVGQHLPFSNTSV